MNVPDYYESARALSEYLLFHYGPPAKILPWSFGPYSALDYPVRCVTECLDTERLPTIARALDLGCAVGRSTFELARYCKTVIGIDYSQSFIEAARYLQKYGSMPFHYAIEGELTAAAFATVPGEIDRSRLQFEQGDAQSLRSDLGQFEVVLLANLVDRLTDPRRCLESLHPLVTSKGQLILTTPCTWLENFTPRSNWLGGYDRNGVRIRTLETLQEILSPHFSLAGTRDLPFLIREHERKFQWSVALGTLWFRR